MKIGVVMSMIMTNWQFWCLLVTVPYLLTGLIVSAVALLLDEDLRHEAVCASMLLVGYIVVSVIWPLILFGGFLCDADEEELSGDKSDEG